jgi:ferritin-like metal-binding protein YciE
MSMESLHELMLEELRDIYHSEKQLVKAMPELAQAASHPALKEALENHLAETEEQVKTLKKVFKELGVKAEGKRCKAMQGILAEAQEVLDDAENIPEGVLDAAIIGLAQKVEHYEIASYGTVIAYSRLMGHDTVTEHLRGILEEEEGADNALSGLAEKEINAMAMA